MSLLVNQLIGFGAAGDDKRVEFVGWSTSTSSPTALTGLTGGTDTQAREGDLVLMITGHSRSGTDEDHTCSTAGFVELLDINGVDTQYAGLGVFWKIMTSSPDASVATSIGGNWDTRLALVFRKVDQTTPFDATRTTATGGNSAVPDNPSITTVTPNALVVAIGCGVTADNSATVPTDYSNYASSTAGTTSTGISIWTASKTVASPGAENPSAWTGITTYTSSSWCAATIALRPA